MLLYAHRMRQLLNVQLGMHWHLVHKQYHAPESTLHMMQPEAEGPHGQPAQVAETAATTRRSL